MNLHRREEFLVFTTLFMGGMMLLAWTLAYWAGISLGDAVHWNLRDVGIGVLAALGMAVVFSQVSEARSQAEEILGPALQSCRWHDFIPLAIMVGFVEELLFRGVLEPWAARFNPWVAYFAVNALFGALHAVSWRYGLLAMALGCLLSSLAHHIDPPNLLRPIVAHAVYDFIGFVWISRSWEPPETEPAELPNDDSPDANESEDHAG